VDKVNPAVKEYGVPPGSHKEAGMISLQAPDDGRMALQHKQPDRPNPESGYLAPAMAASYLGVSLAAVRAWRKAGRFPPAYMLGRLPRWRREDLDAWARTRRERIRTGLYTIGVRPSRGEETGI
jgi:excisionase family DNA binding protein